jgi:hypothetical protein
MQEHRWHLVCATLLSWALFASGPAGAQSAFFVRIIGAPGTITCAADSVIATGGTFALTWNVPASELDATLDGQVNGATVISGPVTIPGSSGTVPGDLEVSFPPVSFPYTFTARLTPSTPGIPPTGISFFCPAAGPGTNFTILATGSAEIPALSSFGLACLSVLLAIAGVVALRRSASGAA